MMHVSQLNVYPVKSLDGFSPASAKVTSRGLEHDRRWLLVDEYNVFMTQRQFGKMALLRATVNGERLRIVKKQTPADFIEVPLTTDKSAETAAVQIWDDYCAARFVSADADGWLSEALGKTCRLVYMPDDTERAVDPDYNTGADIVSFADAYPFLLIGEASLADLNSRLAEPVEMRRFRPNIVFAGGAPYEEDAVRGLRIRGLQFKGVKPCGRCVLTTRDPDTGEKGREPLETLTTYRKKGVKVLFGQNLVWDSRAWTKEGAPILQIGDPLVWED